MTIRLEGICPLLEVFDMTRALAMYRDVLGFEVVQSAPPGDDCDWCLLRKDGAELMLNTMYERENRPPGPDPARTEAHADTALFFGCRDLDAAYAHVRRHGIEAKPPVVRDYGMRQLSFTDPDGYHICLQCPAP
ncbi:MAG: VOC family protein [Gemmatimonadota bacterium]|nr:VOC family protein [Gemmatimonadota bacterium]